MNLIEMLDKMKSGELRLLDSGHRCNPVVDKMERYVTHLQEAVRKQEELVLAGDVPEEGFTTKPSVMLGIFKKKLEDDAEHGKYVGLIEEYCWNCDEYSYVVLIDDSTYAFVGTSDFWRISEERGGRWSYRFRAEDVPRCSGEELYKSKVLRASINMPSGELVFVNAFSGKLRDVEDRYERKKPFPSINSLVGRDVLMQELADRDVGYGQMSNMSVAVWCNGGEVIVCDAYMDDFICDYRDMPGLSFGNVDGTPYESMKEERFNELKKKYDEILSLMKELSSGGFKHLGDISCSVWRWQCADALVIKESGTKLEKKGRVTAMVTPGRWEVEHYFDFPENGDVVYSRLKKQKAND